MHIHTHPHSGQATATEPAHPHCRASGTVVAGHEGTELRLAPNLFLVVRALPEDLPHQRASMEALARHLSRLYPGQATAIIEAQEAVLARLRAHIDRCLAQEAYDLAPHGLASGDPCLTPLTPTSYALSLAYTRPTHWLGAQPLVPMGALHTWRSEGPVPWAMDRHLEAPRLRAITPAHVAVLPISAHAKMALLHNSEAPAALLRARFSTRRIDPHGGPAHDLLALPQGRVGYVRATPQGLAFAAADAGGYSVLDWVEDRKVLRLSCVCHATPTHPSGEVAITWSQHDWPANRIHSHRTVALPEASFTAAWARLLGAVGMLAPHLAARLPAHASLQPYGLADAPAREAAHRQACRHRATGLALSSAPWHAEAPTTLHTAHGSVALHRLHSGADGAWVWIALPSHPLCAGMVLAWDHQAGQAHAHGAPALLHNAPVAAPHQALALAAALAPTSPLAQDIDAAARTALLAVLQAQDTATAHTAWDARAFARHPHIQAAATAEALNALTRPFHLPHP